MRSSPSADLSFYFIILGSLDCRDLACKQSTPSLDSTYSGMSSILPVKGQARVTQQLTHDRRPLIGDIYHSLGIFGALGRAGYLGMEQIALFYGTFIDLPRSESGKEHRLSIKHGALWMSLSTGRITGSDWTVSSEEELQALIRRNGWNSGQLQVIRARDEENEFFFPGFIGMSECR